MPIDLTSLLAPPLTPSIEIRLSPTQSISVDIVEFEKRKAEILDYCKSMDLEGKLSWKELQEHTDGNGTMAKLLIAMGDLIGAWSMHPPVHLPDLWRSSNAFPMILSGTQTFDRTRRIPKPSAGDLDVGTVTCPKCNLPMGKYGSKVHDYIEAEPGSKCISFDPDQCEMLPNPETITKVAEEIVQDDPEEGPVDEFEDYIKQFTSIE
tara:strand:- start:4861 stop:5481 length:621 start_codon:yes stop_codon:yes gene_type:complete